MCLRCLHKSAKMLGKLFEMSCAEKKNPDFETFEEFLDWVEHQSGYWKELMKLAEERVEQRTIWRAGREWPVSR